MTVSNVNTIASQNLKNYDNKVSTNAKAQQVSAVVELSATAEQYLSKGVASENNIAKNIDYKEESMNFSKESINNYSGSFTASQANTHSSRVANLTA